MSYERPSWAREYYQGLLGQAAKPSAGDLLAHQAASPLARPLAVVQEVESLALYGHRADLKDSPKQWVSTVQMPLVLSAATDHITLNHLVQIPQSKENSDG